MDFSKAFNKVSHTKLLYKIGKIINNSQAVNWISAYITKRGQLVFFADCSSNRQIVDSGVLQGSGLGPLLFLLFKNDIVEGIPVRIKLYADDGVVYNEICKPADEQVLSNALQIVSSWCDEWKWLLPSKKQCLSKTLIKNPLQYVYSTTDTKLSEAPHYKYLGVWITTDLNCTKHSNMVTNSRMRKMFFLRRALKLSPPPSAFWLNKQ